MENNKIRCSEIEECNFRECMHYKWHAYVAFCDAKCSRIKTAKCEGKNENK
ncbi:MAG: hypothetical protein E3K37_01455 [Candidatus Kuenenia sp.]|nr:hypothetical protein [Candidatus Kuenenia hertensis]